MAPALHTADHEAAVTIITSLKYSSTLSAHSVVQSETDAFQQVLLVFKVYLLGQHARVICESFVFTQRFCWQISPSFYFFVNNS